ncbi:GNAT family N-acetyltransferase [Pararhizobium sp. YC-54]|uniref:GNAT family N-acetyltransferase n=1 Tax=Pararhizobium sp. YC-54 TaxID=2986920 RepID=UPI0021F7B78C|nr:GNAT family N-acetyltransferase [Pararhizobium sp. YC-54]MCV9998244.1 GNAT family N-acetyltransferase [Pararhizobium sp. YC-54]
MHDNNPELPKGYSPVPAGKVANVVTFLEMRQRPAETAGLPELPLTLARLGPHNLDIYRRLFRDIGEDWLWVSMLEIGDDEVRGILAHPSVETYALRDGGSDIGLVELDFRVPGECELVYFGLVKDAIGKGTGRFLMNQAIAKAFAQPIERFWLHTCTFDHPSAAGFYQRSGFKPYKLMVEVHDDPRLMGLLPKTAAPHIPLLEPAASAE